MKVFLIGLPGCGKTTMGKQIARALNFPFVDLDAAIETSEGATIMTIFQKQGEQRFRKIENQILKEWCAKEDNFVMATGGGTPCFHSNIDLINQSGISVFMDTPVGEIAKRMMKTELAKRPLFANQTIETIQSRIQQMREERLPFYSKARLHFAGEKVEATEIVKALLASEGKSQGN